MIYSELHCDNMIGTHSSRIITHDNVKADLAQGQLMQGRWDGDKGQTDREADQPVGKSSLRLKIRFG